MTVVVVTYLVWQKGFITPVANEEVLAMQRSNTFVCGVDVDMLPLTMASISCFGAGVTTGSAGDLNVMKRR
jgi:hypothetical protein